MLFEVLDRRRFPSSDGPRASILVPDGWNDFGYYTLYDLWFRDGNGDATQLGSLKIGRLGLEIDQRPVTAGLFNSLDHDQFSVGQDDSYYEEIQKLGDDTRLAILRGLRDIALDEGIFDLAIDEDVTQTSLFRSVELPTVEHQFRRMARGGARLTDYRFQYVAPAPGDDPGETGKALTFEVTVGATPSTNIHVLIGRNGSGKTTVLRNIASSLALPDPDHAAVGTTKMIDPIIDAAFTNCLMVTFSAFDVFAPLPDTTAAEGVVGHAFIGLRETNDPFRRDRVQLLDDFAESIEDVLRLGRQERWLRLVEILQSDPYFEQIPAASMIESLLEDQALLDLDEFRGELWEKTTDVFEKLSAGHKIVLLTVTRLVTAVAERSLVLVDEPETHLHPPLLASFVRVLSDLLIDRNGVAVIATHSPVVLQEVPRSCVWKVTRWNDGRAPERPQIETFGENVGVLTHEVFGLEVQRSGFHQELTNAVNRFETYEEVLNHFGRQLGSEAKSLVRVLLAAKLSTGCR
ncbi:AAA family ATPase [Kitasatospora sp. NPDC096204]|uniref:AAA family ATPase n=1 Tax=Kitasatospora sp. NPDC096204 TaxID=3364094 RepID=UPI0038234283